RPVLRTAQRDQFAGRIVAVPPENYRVSQRAGRSGQFRLLAEVADHDLVTPSAGVARRPADLLAWILDNVGGNFGLGTDGLILSWERINAAGRSESDRLLNQIRRQSPRLPVFLIVEKGLPPEALDHLQSGRVDLIACSADEKLAPDMTGKILRFNDPAELLPLLIARMVNLRFGESPRIYPVYSPANAIAGTANDQLSGSQLISSRIKNQVRRQIVSIGATEFVPGPAAGTPDIILFIQLPGSNEVTLRSMIAGLQETIERNVRVAILDLTTDRESKERLFVELQRRRWLDRLAGFAASEPAEAPAIMADSISSARAISQSSLFLVAIHSLRDDLDRLYRTDRAQVRLLFSRYLTDYIYQLRIRDDLESGYRPGSAENSAEKLEERALQQMQPLATTLFNEQFRRNIHATRLASGDRAQFEIRLFQQLRLRLFIMTVPKGSRSRIDVEVAPSIHLAYLGNIPFTKISWELTNDDPDSRLVNRWLEIPWGRFETGSERVLVTFRLDQKFGSGFPDASQGYRIRNRRSRATRLIEIIAGSNQGLFYGLNRLEQLGGTGQLSRDLDLTERPRNQARGIIEAHQGSWSLRERLDLIAFLGRNRLNNYTILINPATEISEPAMAQLRRAADASFVNLTIRQSLPNGSSSNRVLSSDDSRFCSTAVSPEAPTESSQDSEISFQLSGTPYALWPILTLAAEAAWDPATFDASAAIDHFLAAEGGGLRGLRATSPATASGIDRRQDCIDLPILNPDHRPTSGRRTAALIRGELKNSIINSKAARSAR
ncbi:MAG: DUF4127 family protein, partial [Blastocatellia bacterium]